MDTLLVLAIFANLLFLLIIFELLHKNNELRKRVRNFGDVKLWHTLAFKDDLTGIYNRTAYSRHVDEIEKMDTVRGYAIVLFDIDDFKKINDTKGHLEGDVVLKNVAKTLVSVFSSHKYTVYRIGGDEFAVIAEDITERQLISSMIKLSRVMERSGDVRLSKGYSIIQGSVKAAFKNADEMLYADKESKRQLS